MSGLLCCAKNIPTYTKVVRTFSCTSSIFEVSIHLRKPVNVTMNLNGKFKKRYPLSENFICCRLRSLVFFLLDWHVPFQLPEADFQHATDSGKNSSIAAKLLGWHSPVWERDKVPCLSIGDNGHVLSTWLLPNFTGKLLANDLIFGLFIQNPNW